MNIKYIFLLLLLPLMAAGVRQYKASSVLGSGSWYKISVQKSGIYKISYEELISMGFQPGQLASGAVRIYGNGAGMLPESNNAFRYDDLRENPLKVVDGGDGMIDPGDFVLFYGESPDKWSYNPTAFSYTHAKNLYSDHSYYFVTISDGNGARVVPAASSTLPATTIIDKYTDYAFHELDSLNLIRSGRIWYGEVFNDKKDDQDYYFSFPDLNTDYPVRLVINVAARAPVQSKFYLSDGATYQDSVSVDPTDPQSIAIFARPKQKVSFIEDPGSGEIHLHMKYDLPDANSSGWLDYLELNCVRNLVWKAPQLSFRDAGSVGMFNVTEYFIAQASPGMEVWDISDREHIASITGTITGNEYRFRITTDTLQEFIAFDGSFFHSVNLEGVVANQNLHAIQPHDMIIVTNPLFLEQADSLAEFHSAESGLSVVVVTTEHVFNEFASGNSDPTAIRDFVKMLYDRGYPGNEPKYLLLFGDGSYDPKDRVPNNNNMVPTYQSVESLKYIGTYVTDDYFGVMADNAGENSNGSIMIGIGRFPVIDNNGASILLKKIMNYSSSSDTVRRDWRNIITFVADNENKNLHMIQAEQLAHIVKTRYPQYNVNKIYIDAYPFVPTPAGDRCPDANRAITEAVTKGCLILNYTGHGGEGGWAAEKILTSEDIQTWKNPDNLPVFITATCEFSRFDNPERYTAGEMVLMQPDGGAIALYSTTRLALSTSNFRLDSSFFLNLLPPEGEPVPKMGDLIRLSKNFNGNNNNIRNFVLLGDPAQSIAHPQYKALATEINHHPISLTADTALGLSTVSVKGKIVDNSGNKLDGFNGTLITKVFDKPTTYQTLANQAYDSYKQNFELQNSLLFHGKSTISGGDFDFTFVVPKSIALQFGRGKISFYARNAESDANGYFSNIIFGGEDESIDPHNPGPAISLFMGSDLFRNGDKVESNTELIAMLSDENGINSTGLGIGHEIVAYLDDDELHPIMLNDYYIPDMDQYGKGTVRYPVTGLANGRHTLKLKAWDMFNNASEADIYFFVSDYPQLSVNQVINFPNPFRDATTFSFNAIRDAGDLKVNLKIFDLAGMLVTMIESQFPANDQGILTIPWDGTGNNGQPLSAGLYVYRLNVTGENGATFSASQKLLIQGR